MPSGMYTRTEEMNKKMSLLKKGFMPVNIFQKGHSVSKETRIKIGNSNKGRIPTNAFKIGHTVSEEIRKKLSKFNLGKKLSEETKRKMSLARKGRPISEQQKMNLKPFLVGHSVSQEMRMKMSLAKKGKVGWSKGKHLSEEHKRKISLSSKGRKGSWLGKLLSEEHKRKIGLARMGKSHSKESKEKMSLKHIGENNPMYGISGECSPGWKGGLSFEPYGLEFNNQLRNQVRKRDGNTCQICKNGEFLNRNRKLSIHHVDYNKQNNSIDNLTSLCTTCHIKTNYNRDKWICYFTKLKEELKCLS